MHIIRIELITNNVTNNISFRVMGLYRLSKTCYFEFFSYYFTVCCENNIIFTVFAIIFTVFAIIFTVFAIILTVLLLFSEFCTW